MFDPDHVEVIDQVQSPDGTVVQILQYERLMGSGDVRTAQNLYYAQQSGMRLKMIRIILNDGYARVEPGALYFMKGNLELKASTGGGLLKGLARKMVSGESLFVSEIHGTGEIYLEPTYGHFFLHGIEKNERGVIVDKGLFYAGTAGLDISAVAQKNVSSALFGGEGLFQTHIQGRGVAVLYSPVPQQEVVRVPLKNEKLSVDGNFALMRSQGIDFRAERSSKSFIAASASGEGMLQTFSGTGYVWIAPTQGVYARLATAAGLRALSLPPGAMGTEVETKM